MAVTDEQVAALRAQLQGRSDEHVRWLDHLEETGATDGYVALVTGAFFEAADRRFLEDDQVAEESEIVEFVAVTRAAHPNVADDLDPSVAERVLLHALGKGSVQGIDGGKVLATQLLLMGALISEADLNEAELETFLTKARGEADAHLD
ncbi:hypothetical protein E1281_39030 [Actinomadura sp. KC345]|uniref:hypothetical protein n=1 Tax=Actinomadura sp. KC345 TaxID=2530371 RepID=UPI001044B92F|nr:hypothetical protein [Actinomadura sp. KC345]TDC38732.1 hypothetical protein E1281_39030 [Actinomadura sp. KC345]